MQMATISRWTLSFFGCGLLALLTALGLMAGGWGVPNEALAAPMTLIIVHLIAIGWLSLLIIGALFQFLPVLVGRELAWPKLTPLVLILVVIGLLLMLAGFWALEGTSSWSADLLPIGGLVVISGFVLGTAILIATLLRATTVPLPAGFVAIALMGALVATFLGDSLGGAMSGVIGGDFAMALVTHGVALHAAFGLGGWLTLAAMGVSYRLVSMFLIAPERTGATPRLALVGSILTLVFLCAALAMLLIANAAAPMLLGVAGLAALCALGSYLFDIVQLYRTRRRKQVELHMEAAAGAFVMLALSALLLVWGNLAGHERGIAAAVHLLALGWLGGLGLAMLYKIVPFLTWLECFAPLMGREPTPRVQDLVREARAGFWFVLYFAGTMTASAAIGLGSGLLFQGASALQLLAVLALIHQFYRARALADLPAPWANHSRPRLLLPAQRLRRSI